VDRLTSDPEVSGRFGANAISAVVGNEVVAAAGSLAPEWLVGTSRGARIAGESAASGGRVAAPSSKPLVIDHYDIMSLRQDLPGQANHLLQNGAYNSQIPSAAGLSIKLEGDALFDVGSPHYNFHEGLESFWDQYRPGGVLEGAMPTNSQYNRALYNVLQESGLTSTDALNATRAAKAQQLEYGLRGSGSVPKLPRRMNQTPRP
jgi:hypothetical protein